MAQAGIHTPDGFVRAAATCHLAAPSLQIVYTSRALRRLSRCATKRKTPLYLPNFATTSFSTSIHTKITIPSNSNSMTDALSISFSPTVPVGNMSFFVPPAIAMRFQVLPGHKLDPDAGHARACIIVVVLFGFNHQTPAAVNTKSDA